MSISDNLQRVRERIVQAAEAAGRSPDEVTLVGVTKYVGPAEAAALAAAGCRDLGESRPQELWHKAAALSAYSNERAGSSSTPVPIRWHLVGHLQRNKVSRTLPLVQLIHSVDSHRLLAAIDSAARGGWEGEAPAEPHAEEREGEAPAEPNAMALRERRPPENDRPPARVLLEVNTSGEAAKHGLVPGEVEPLLSAAGRFPHVTVCGLMTMAALAGGLDAAARNFAALRDLRDRLRPNLPDGVRLDELSMGMSRDFEVALREGATIVRVGTALWQE